ncbi:hypothetical protein NKI77_18175 [Mesorhizobium opportunistum]|uniref:Uncharacterized protein n=1 Tax=Mesorhizobium opportunistum TaxID=593909 RepID=A0ABV1YB89_9HYPH
MASRQEVLDLVAKLLAKHFAKDDLVEVATTRQGVYLRLNTMVYLINTENIEAISRAEDPAGAAKRFMATMELTPKPAS